MKTIYLAGGCFWGTEHLMQLVPGVVKTVVGYANSRVANPDYKLVCSGTTGAAETVEVTYNPDEVSLEQLLDLYLKSIDPTSVNRQGGDIGTQYRTGIYYTDAAVAPTINRVIRDLEQEIGQKTAVEVGPLQNFYPAEDYHQDYLVKNPGGYCHVSPGLFNEARKTGKRFNRTDD